MHSLLIKKAGQTAASVEDWFRLAPPPEPDKEWGPGLPVREWARTFFTHPGGATVPADLAKLLASHASLGALTLQHLIPEYRISLDRQPGGSLRCHGMGTASGREGRAALTFHVRTGEGFGPAIGDQLRRSKPGSQWVARITRLTEAVLGKSPADGAGLRSGLVLLAAAALRAAEAEKAATALLIFQEFRPRSARPAQWQQHAADLDAFAAALGGKPLRPGVLAGPFRVPGGQEIPASVPLFLGKTVTLLP